MRVGIVDSGSGNLRSVADAVRRIGWQPSILSLPDLTDVDALILPGQGRFGAVMRGLDDGGWSDPLRQWIASQSPFLGICVGMQVLFSASEEDDGVQGLGILDGKVVALDTPKCPMMGWSEVRWRDQAQKNGAAYFVNGFVVKKSDACVAETDYGGTFCAAVRIGRAHAVQFHPEKSGAWGQEVMRRCLV